MRLFTRRDVLAKFTVAAGVSAAEKPTNYIDAHVHVWTPDTARFPRDRRRAGPEYKPDSFTPEQLLATGEALRRIQDRLDPDELLRHGQRVHAGCDQALSGGVFRSRDSGSKAPGVRDEMIRLEDPRGSRIPDYAGGR